MHCKRLINVKAIMFKNLKIGRSLAMLVTVASAGVLATPALAAYHSIAQVVGVLSAGFSSTGVTKTPE